jgi:beta-galactosidase
MHNGTFGDMDYWRFAADLDFFAVDVYPGFAGPMPTSSFWAAYKNEECRAASGGYIIPEQQGGPGGQRAYLHPTPRPGQMRLWAYQGIAHGADGILHFRWRTCRFGTEIYWNGILDHDNVPRRRYEEFCIEGEELGRIGGTILEWRRGC